MNQYIIAEEDICTIRDYVLGAFYEGENKEKIYGLLESQFSVMRSHPYQSERDKVLDELKRDLKTRFISSSNQWSKGRNSGLIECCNIIDELRRAGEP